MHTLKDHELLFVFTGPNGSGRRTVADMAGSTLGMDEASTVSHYTSA